MRVVRKDTKKNQRMYPQTDICGLKYVCAKIQKCKFQTYDLKISLLHSTWQIVRNLLSFFCPSDPISSQLR